MQAEFTTYYNQYNYNISSWKQILYKIAHEPIINKNQGIFTKYFKMKGTTEWKTMLWWLDPKTFTSWVRTLQNKIIFMYNY